MTSRLKSSLIAACAALTIAGGMAYAGTATDGATIHKDGGQKHGRMHRHGGHEGLSHGDLPMMGTLRQLDLTAEQKQSVRAVFENNAPQRKALHDRQRSNREALAGTMPDDPGYPALIAEKKQLAAEAIQQASDTQTQVFALLTAEQKAKIPQILAERKARWEQRRAERQAQKPVASL